MPIPLQVLIVEDRQTDAELMVHELTRTGYILDWRRVETQAEFYARLTPSVDVVLADYSLPSFSALQALETLQRRAFDIPLIVISGTVDDQRAADCLQAGAADYLLKDRLARLGPAVARLLRERALLRERKGHIETIRLDQEHLSSVFNSLQDAVWSRDAKTSRLLYLNPAAETLLGRTLADFEKEPELWFECIHPDDRARMKEAWAQLGKWGAVNSEFRMLKSTGETRYVEDRAWASFDAQGSPTRYGGILRDVTEERQSKERLRVAEEARREAERLREQNAFKTQFISIAAHDLNNVLTPLKINVHLLTVEGAENLTPSQLKAKKNLAHAVDRLAGFLGDLLEAARLQSGNLSIVPQRFDLAAHVEATVERHQRQAEEQGVTLIADTPGTAWVSADPRRIEQVTTNLLSNALKFTPSGGKVRMTVHVEGANVELKVADTGPGLAEDEIPRLFQPFVQGAGQKQGKHTGTGLGLFICKGIVEGHGGRIWCESPGQGQGATFRVKLPATPGVPDSQSTLQET